MLSQKYENIKCYDYKMHLSTEFILADDKCHPSSCYHNTPHLIKTTILIDDLSIGFRFRIRL